MDKADDSRDPGGCQSDHEETPRPTKRLKPSPPSPDNAVNITTTPAAGAKEIHDPTSEPREDEDREMDLRKQMQLEKQLYPGASAWAEEEEKLFELLFLRQDVPLLPSHWDVDFRGIPVSETVFNTTDEHPQVIYAHSTKEFQATTALMRLIDLTSTVRTTSQSGLRHKVATVIKKSLDQFLDWAAEDGGYDHLRIVPNVMVEAIDVKSMKADHITDYMQYRMKALAHLQQAFLRVDRSPDFWAVVEPWIMNPDNSLHPLLLEKARLVYQKLTTLEDGKPIPDELAAEDETTPTKVEAGVKRLRIVRSPAAEMDELAENLDGRRSKKIKFEGSDAEGGNSKTPDLSKATERIVRHQQETKTPHVNSKDQPPFGNRPEDMSSISFRRTPPVIYGFFVVNTSVFLLTADSAQGDDGYVSFHVEVDFFDSHQSVWNALTIAIAVCMARDELMSRTEDFEPLPDMVESDPDA